METFNSPILAATMMIAFLWLAYYSLQHAPKEGGYTHSVFSVLHKPSTLSNRQSAAIMSLWNITEDDLASPVAIFGKE